MAPGQLFAPGIGSKVCVFGGDIPTTEDEYERIQDRTCCSFVCLGFMVDEVQTFVSDEVRRIVLTL